MHSSKSYKQTKTGRALVVSEGHHGRFFIAPIARPPYRPNMTKPAKKHSTKRDAPKRIPRTRRKPNRPPPSPDDVLTPQEELFVELYFITGFQVLPAYGKAGYSSSARAQAYKKLNEPHIQAAIARRRVELRARATITQAEKMQILVACMTDVRAGWRDRLAAIMIHNRMVAGDAGAQSPMLPDDRSEITPGALRQLSQDELIEAINSGRILKARAKVIDVARETPALPAPAVQAAKK